MYELYIANKNYSSWSLRPWLLMRELQIPFKEQLAVFGPDANFHKFSPTGRVPCLHDGSVVVWDSLAIAEYLAERHPEVWPQDPAARAWARCAAAEMHSGFSVLRERCGMSCGMRMRLHEMPAELLADIRRIDALWNEGLTRFGGPFLAGPRFTAADAFFAPVAFRIQTYGLELSAPALGWAQRARELPGMQAWYGAALQERFRDPPHEDWILQAGTCIADLRAPPH
jgi:glutathione S-transferase